MKNTILDHPVGGEIFAVVSAFLWAFVAILFRKLGEKVSPLAMNLGKSVIAAIFLGAVLLCTTHAPMSAQSIIFLGISGFLGISLGDTFFFKSLIMLGPRLSLVITTLIPVVTILLGSFLLQESLTFMRWIGIFLTLSGVSLVLWEKTGGMGSALQRTSGIVWGLGAVLCCASAVIFSKIALKSTSALQATFIRQISGAMGLLLWGLVDFKVKDWVQPLWSDPNLIKKLIWASFLGTFLGTLFCLLALKHTSTAIATTLNATSPLFILPLAFFMLKEKISLRAVLGALVAVLGVSLIFLKER